MLHAAIAALARHLRPTQHEVEIMASYASYTDIGIERKFEGMTALHNKIRLTRTQINNLSLASGL